MPVVTTTLALIVFAAGTVAGGLGAALGIGGGVFLAEFILERNRAFVLLTALVFLEPAADTVAALVFHRMP